MRWWSGRFSALFKPNEVNSRKWVVFKSKFISSQSKAFKFVSSDAYFKPYAIDITDRYECVVESGIVACIGCCSLLTAEQVSYVFSEFRGYAVFGFGDCIEWAFEITQSLGRCVFGFG